MITKITMDNIASYKKPTFFETDKKINLIYGLNGTGKSIFSEYLYNQSNSNDQLNSEYSDCSIEGLNDKDILVYNQKFIQDHFYQKESLKGIFTISKDNKEALEKINKAEQEKSKLEKEKEDKNKEKDRFNEDLKEKKEDAENKVWEIKKKYTGGDRVLEYCFDSLKGKKDRLFDHLSQIEKPAQKPKKETNQLKSEVSAIKGDKAQKYNPLPSINSEFFQEVELDPIFKKVIIGNENSTVSDLIKSLNNSDWVQKGLVYLPEKINAQEPCPFCQQPTITNELKQSIQDYFDKSYSDKLDKVKKLLSKYEDSVNKHIPKKNIFQNYPFIENKKHEFENLYNTLSAVLNNNKEKIKNKIQTPSQQSLMKNSKKAIDDFNNFIQTINEKITAHNHKMDNKEKTLGEIKNQFWDIMRWDYDQTLSFYESEKHKIGEKINDIQEKIKNIQNKISIQEKTIKEHQGQTSNIQEAIDHINHQLKDLGISNFEIKKHDKNFYKIIREGQSSDTFQTLSEGEKMIISFLYFCELCKGKKTASSPLKKKIIVIDDPISSLSHIYIFNVGMLIKETFLESNNYEQIILLTHSLYFFHELSKLSKRLSKKQNNPKLFRMIKNSEGSQILKMEDKEIQNDYQSYWSIVKDRQQPPALMANCMRQILEYFFGFIEKESLNEVFKKDIFKELKYQAFHRYMNRESHFDSQNISDTKELDYENFREAFQLVFKESGYKKHYDRIMKPEFDS